MIGLTLRLMQAALGRSYARSLAYRTALALRLPCTSLFIEYRYFSSTHRRDAEGENPQQPLHPLRKEGPGKASQQQSNESTTLETDLWFQSSVASRTPHLLRQVDDPDRARDLELWLRLLQFRERIDGWRGIALIWRGMRNRLVELSTDPTSEAIWRTLLRNHDLHQSVFDYAVDLRNGTGKTFEPMYAIILGSRIQSAPESVIWWHKKFRQNYHIRDKEFRNLAVAAARSKTGLAQFKKIYADCLPSQHHVYDPLVSALCHQGRYYEAERWHMFLISHGDTPSPAMSASPAMEGLRNYRWSMASTPKLAGDHFDRKHSTTSESNPPPAPKPPNKTAIDSTAIPAGFTRETMGSFLGLIPAIPPKKFSDEFCARLFATKAFSLSSVIGILSMFSVEVIGPLALRELTLRAATCSEISQKIGELRIAGIRLEDRMFCRAVEKLAIDDNQTLLDDLLETDQHPEALEDTDLQKKLLAVYIQQEDWPRIRFMLGLLTLFNKDPTTESWNLFLQHYAGSKDLAKLSKILNDMRQAGIHVTNESMDVIQARRLEPRKPGTPPKPTEPGEVDDVDVVANILFQTIASGDTVSALRWREIIRRYGMKGRFDDLSGLLFRLAQVYNAETRVKSPLPLGHLIDFAGDKDQLRTIPRLHPSHPLREICDANLQRAVVTWGFTHGALVISEQLKLEKDLETGASEQQLGVLEAPAVVATDSDIGDLGPEHLDLSPSNTILRGLILLQDLASKGVVVQTEVVKKVVKERLWQLFSPGTSSRRLNRKAKDENLFTMEEIVQAIESIWTGRPLFPELAELPFTTPVLQPPAGRKDGEEQPEPLLRFHGSKSKLWRSTGLHDQFLSA
ncbi:hypothetical protein EJ06DRAFT_523429 [Trichodelitschia bisporula]|uniref:Pentatricopeptide repeat protein n=1 Tax=Trichodelitschia bisporula TaxID=703511 RepID=A0A6G1HPT5_9PEZI|nr:hypothetical protein EJ06DRAFT_523429 [Trichodelitschia bisporula]